VRLTLACSDYDHVRDFANGVVRADGIDLTWLTSSVEEIFFRFTRYREWDVSELSMGKYISLRSQGDDSLSAIPVFPSRVFRQSSIFVRRDGPVRTIEDLRGRRVGVPEWSQTAAVYTRGFLMHEYGIALDEIDWVQAGVNEPGRDEKVRLKLPKGVRLAPVMDRSLDEMLGSGALDAIATAHPPQSFENSDPNIVRLFANYREIELAYFRKTGIFPIMHVIAIRSEILREHPWVARNLFDAFERAKARSLERARTATASRFPLPWIFAVAADAQAEFGADWWPYGIEPNRTTLEAFARFAHEQGVAHRLVRVEELFPETLRSTFKI
jgi:4,5-dihydroxyphthalate decarboxylase